MNEHDPPHVAIRNRHAKGLKMHLREVHVGSYTYRVVTLRASTTTRFSTNYFHQTWHLLTDGEGAALLARLFWGLAFQRMPGTLLLIEAEHLVPTPFEADPPCPVMVIPAELTRVSPHALRALRYQLRKPMAQKTIRWHTFGMPEALRAERDFRTWGYGESRHQRTLERVSQIAGMVCITLPAAQLREDALAIARMANVRESNYMYLAEGAHQSGWSPDGEVQVFRHFRSMVSTARVARAHVLDSKSRIGTRDERQAIIERAAGNQLRLRSART